MVIMIILKVIRIGNTIRRTGNIDNKILNKKIQNQSSVSNAVIQNCIKWGKSFWNLIPVSDDVIISAFLIILS